MLAVSTLNDPRDGVGLVVAKPAERVLFFEVDLNRDEGRLIGRDDVERLVGPSELLKLEDDAALLGTFVVKLIVDDPEAAGF